MTLSDLHTLACLSVVNVDYVLITSRSESNSVDIARPFGDFNG